MSPESPANYLSFLFSRQEQQLILANGIAIEPAILRLIANGKRQGDSIKVRISLKELELLTECVAVGAKRTRDRQTQEALDDVVSRLSSLRVMHAMNLRSSDTEDPFMESLRSALQGDFGSFEEINAVMASVAEQYNSKPNEELGGLSPMQIHQLINQGWWSKDCFISLSDKLEYSELDRIDFFANCRTYLCALQDSGGAPCTAKGNLNRKFVSQMLEQMRFSAQFLEDLHRYNNVINEDDLFPLHLIRVFSQLAGLSRKYKKRFVLTQKGKKQLEEGKAGALYTLLFNTFFRKFNLAYLDSMPQISGLQSTLPYALFRISQMPAGDQDLDSLCSLILLPDVIEEAEHCSRYEDTAQSMAVTRIWKPLEKLGLVELKHRKEEGLFYESPTHVSKSDLFDKFLKFDIK